MDEQVEVPLPSGCAPVCFRIAGRLLGEVASPGRSHRVPDGPGVIRRALDAPIGTPRLEQMVKPGQKLAVVVDDVSRPTPARIILPHVFQELSKAGIPDEDVVLVMALGSHRPMTDREIADKIGKKAVGRFDVVNVSCDEARHFQDLGKTRNNIRAKILKKVANADVRIGVGAIFPHMDAGFSGGAKIILPGVAARETVDAFHAPRLQTWANHLGNPEAPARKILEDFVLNAVGLDFIVNVVLDMENRVTGSVAGDPVEAHRKGVALARAIYGARVKKRYPMVIANSFPMEIDFWQCTKAIWSGEMMTADKGLLVLVSPCPEGTATHPMFAALLENSAQALFSMAQKGGNPDPTALSFAAVMAKIRQRVRFALVSPGIGPESARKMGMEPFDTVEQAIAAESDRLGAGDVGVLTHGGTSFPVLP